MGEDAVGDTLSATVGGDPDPDDSSDTGSPTDTGSSADTGGTTDTGVDSDETEESVFEVGDVVICYAAPVDSAGGTGESIASNSVEVTEASTDDTGGSDTATDSSLGDTQEPGFGAAHHAGEQGGWGCASVTTRLAPVVSLWGILLAIAWRRRDQV